MSTLDTLQTSSASLGAPLRIQSIEAIPVIAPFSRLYPDGDVPGWLLQPAASHRTLQRKGQYSTLIRIRTEDGLEGVGECYGLPAPKVTAQVVRDIIEPLLIGEDANAIDRLWSRVFTSMSGGGQVRGYYLEAMSGVDIALWDLKGKAYGVPVHSLLGGPHRDRVAVYASPIPMLETPAESATYALGFVEQGFDAIKLKLGRGRRVDLAHAAAVREAIGDERQLLVDLNCAYTADVAVGVVAGLVDLGITWIEEPCAVDDVAGYRRIRDSAPVSLVNGETLFTRWDQRDFLVQGAVDVVMPNLARAGGITESRKLAALCETFHVDIAPHGVGSAVGLAAALHLSAAIPNFRIYEYNRLPNPLRDELTVEPFDFAASTLAVPTGPGLGIELDWDRVDQFRAE
ncbi:mandelate racemase/muconate lactonizing enzyme family protein [Microbacterium sp. Au-Mic1]|uniref:mandelate racemase/muconate lactonizing enzyme family protein n=1 Tax=Microbacterium sp. Au-Mic1 TaxID=2906457 RepID=UPI001E2D6A5A|nr:mandelate racemase/muconate lactonizing enzyme family protein [Microbacterium sp. Au-Mic1]MCE4026272.1 mandelate racemase/muconate lactonizing enzyme family protein [Microbacterium sp. Au-Mic1]